MRRFASLRSTTDNDYWNRARGMSANAGNPVLQSYQAWSERTPFVTRTSVVVLVIMYIISFFVALDDYLGNIPYFTMLRFEVYRILLASLAGNSIFTILLVFMTYPTLGVKMEGSMGSSAFLWLLFMIGIVVNITFNIICGLLFLVGTHEALLYNCMDFWTILFALITIDCLYQPDAPRRLLFIPYDIPSKYIPLLLYAIICLFSGFLLSYALSMLIGYLWSKGHLDRIRPSSVYLSDLEAPGGWLHYISRSRSCSFALKCVSFFIYIYRSGWVLAGTLGHDAWIPVATAEDPEEGGAQQASAPPQPRGGGFFGGNAAASSGGVDRADALKDQVSFAIVVMFVTLRPTFCSFLVQDAS